jgi:hypothetical protein
MLAEATRLHKAALGELHSPHDNPLPRLKKALKLLEDTELLAEDSASYVENETMEEAIKQLHQQQGQIQAVIIQLEARANSFNPLPWLLVYGSKGSNHRLSLVRFQHHEKRIIQSGGTSMRGGCALECSGKAKSVSSTFQYVSARSEFSRGIGQLFYVNGIGTALDPWVAKGSQPQGILPLEFSPARWLGNCQMKVMKGVAAVAFDRTIARQDWFMSLPNSRGDRALG